MVKSRIDLEGWASASTSRSVGLTLDSQPQDDLTYPLWKQRQ